MSTQGDGPLVSESMDDGVPVGAADAGEDIRRSGADTDEPPVRAAHTGMPDIDTPDQSDDGVPVGRADAEADRRRSSGDDGA